MSLTRHGYGAVLVEPGWQVLSDLPYPVQEIYPALHKGCIYVAGGLASINGKTAATERHVRYSIADDRWTELAPLPEARHHLQLVTVNDAIYALGGFRQEGNNGLDHDRAELAV
ncbi:hypothetical protein [Pseudomaricurvus hydrocarbonicus]|nr:hypothetical protein [Aestuariicella hydrocarbonica]